jgi:CBS domain-containing protein
MKDLLVADVMTRDLLTVSTASSLMECAKKMVKNKVGSLVIVEHGKLVGIISQKDILWVVTKKAGIDLTKVKSVDVSPKKIAIIGPNNTIKETIEKMNRLKFERLPVVHKNKLVGFITARDILNVHPEVYPEMEEFARIREESEKLSRIKKAEQRREGICEECGHEGILFRANGMLVCESCKDAI